MARLLLILALIVFALPAAALDDTLSSQAPPKPVSVIVPPPAAPEITRQGGDTIADATVIPGIPYYITGTTTGFNDDYDEVCPYSGSTAPDVVYTFVAPCDLHVNIDLFGSTYDTKVFVYDENLALVACNDDFYPDYVSMIEGMPVQNGVQYFVVIDGYSGAFGDYVLDIDEYIPPPPCIIDCPPTGVLEGEPPLAYNYEDNWNSGCGHHPDALFQFITNPVFCGVSGFYTTGAGNSRDTDWFIIEMPPGGVLEVTGDAEVETYMFELGPQDCATVGVIQNVIIGPCIENNMTIVGPGGAPVWFWVGPTDFYAPDGSDLFEYDYVLLLNIGVATEDHTWTGVKALFR